MNEEELQREEGFYPWAEEAFLERLWGALNEMGPDPHMAIMGLWQVSALVFAMMPTLDDRRVQWDGRTGLEDLERRQRYCTFWRACLDTLIAIGIEPEQEYYEKFTQLCDEMREE